MMKRILTFAALCVFSAGLIACSAEQKSPAKPAANSNASAPSQPSNSENKNSNANAPDSGKSDADKTDDGKSDADKTKP